VRDVLRNFNLRTSSPIEIDLALRAENDDVLIDKSQIGHVLLSLLRNSREALDGATDGRIRISTCLEGENLRLTIADNGPGILPDIRERLFEPLITSKPGGKGIGLSICKSIVEAHYGTLTALDDHGAGAAFSFTLPLARAETLE
jgi:signal transduction histidine kinase